DAGKLVMLDLVVDVDELLLAVDVELELHVLLVVGTELDEVAVVDVVELPACKVLVDGVDVPAESDVVVVVAHEASQHGSVGSWTSWGAGMTDPVTTGGFVRQRKMLATVAMSCPSTVVALLPASVIVAEGTAPVSVAVRTPVDGTSIVHPST